MDQLRDLQRQLLGFTKKTGASTGTALMLLGLCFSLFVSPEAMATGTLPASFTAAGSLIADQRLLARL